MTSVEMNAGAAADRPAAETSEEESSVVSGGTPDMDRQTTALGVPAKKSNATQDDGGVAGFEAQIALVAGEADDPASLAERDGPSHPDTESGGSTEQGTDEHWDVAAAGEDGHEPNTEMYDHLGYEEAAPQLRRRQHQRRSSSLLGHLMGWAGAVNQEYMDSEFQPQQAVVNGGADPCGGSGGGGGGSATSGYHDNSRRASVDTVRRVHSGSTAHQRPRRVSRRCHSTDDADGWEAEAGADAADAVPHGEDLGVEANGRGRGAQRRNSLHAMIERAMAYVNLRPDRNDDDLTPFGTRRDSLY